MIRSFPFYREVKGLEMELLMLLLLLLLLLSHFSRVRLCVNP